jgi:hypothetical protein
MVVVSCVRAGIGGCVDVRSSDIARLLVAEGSSRSTVNLRYDGVYTKEHLPDCSI